MWSFILNETASCCQKIIPAAYSSVFAIVSQKPRLYFVLNSENVRILSDFLKNLRTPKRIAKIFKSINSEIYLDERF